MADPPFSPSCGLRREGGKGAPEKGKKAKKRSDKNGGKRRGKCWEVPLQIMIVLTGKKRRRRKGKKRWRWCLACAPSVEASYLRGRNIFLSEKKVSAPLFFAFSKVLWPFLLLLGIHILITLLLRFTCPYPKLASVMDLRLPAGGGAQERSTKYTQKSPHRGPRKRRKTVIVSLLPPSPSPTLFPLPIFARVKLRMKNPKFPTLFFELYVVASPPSFSISRAAKKRRKGERTVVGQFES